MVQVSDLFFLGSDRLCQYMDRCRGCSGDAVRDEESGSTGLCCLSGASCVGYYLRCAVDSVGGLCADCPPVSGRI